MYYNRNSIGAGQLSPPSAGDDAESCFEPSYRYSIYFHANIVKKNSKKMYLF